ncbi:PH domain-containing protein [Massilimicrobiota sp. An134]|uniref:PH domain-containing protein n=1 Tax=Massilimicrobiota sp. An134 TaxID=1965557 RepID=UPI000B395825|nr:PH domain-containing protein [Massilimicrobiota sp. An134]OUQ29132.1 hypothetical protein B5E79_08990 [Massilimicrobiota sp. An134]
MRYYSKIGVIWMIAIAVIVWCNYMLLKPVTWRLDDWGMWLTLLIFIPIDVLFVICTFWTYYEFHDDYLEVRNGYFFHEDILYHDIRSFKETHNPLGSCGLSLDRLDIIYKAQKGRNGNSEVLISPVKKQEFIQELEKRSRIFLSK